VYEILVREPDTDNATYTACG